MEEMVTYRWYDFGSVRDEIILSPVILRKQSAVCYLHQFVPYARKYSAQAAVTP